MRHPLDQIALLYVRWRLARFRRRGDRADRFGDRLIALLSAEIERRNGRYERWDAEDRRAAEDAAERERRQTAIERFQNSGSGDGLRLQ